MLDDTVIIEVALNGSTTPDVNPTVPRAPEEIAEQALACIDAGAAIVHSHPDASRSGDDLTAYREAWAPILKTHPDALLYPTARFGEPGAPVEDLWSHNVDLARDGLAAMSLVDPGSVNVGMEPDGEVRGVLKERAYVNTHGDNEYKLKRSAELGLAPSFSIFDATFLRSVLGFAERGLIPPGAMLKLYFGANKMIGLRPTSTALDAYLELLDDVDLPWSAAVLGGDVFADGFAARVLEHGGHLRVGLEDDDRPSRVTNHELVQRAVDLIEATGRRPASIAETRTLLGVVSLS